MSTETKLATNGGQAWKRFDWFLPILLHPKKTLHEISEQEKAVWLTPLLAISALAVIGGLITLPIRRNAIINSLTLPADFQNYSSDMQAQFMAAQNSQSSVLFTFIFPVLGTLIGAWLGWFLLSSILQLGHSIAGSSTSKRGYFNLVGWAMVPLLIRQVIQILYMVISQHVISASGISGFVNETSSGSAFLAGFLGQIDVWFIWEVILILVGIVPLSGLKKSKSWMVTGGALLIILILFAVPHVAKFLISGIASSGG